MSDFRREMRDEMEVRGLEAKTSAAYLRSMEMFIIFFDRDYLFPEIFCYTQRFITLRIIKTLNSTLFIQLSHYLKRYFRCT